MYHNRLTIYHLYHIICFKTDKIGAYLIYVSCCNGGMGFCN